MAIKICIYKNKQTNKQNKTNRKEKCTPSSKTFTCCLPSTSVAAWGHLSFLLEAPPRPPPLPSKGKDGKNLPFWRKYLDFCTCGFLHTFCLLNTPTKKFLCCHVLLNISMQSVKNKVHPSLRLRILQAEHYQDESTSTSPVMFQFHIRIMTAIIE